MRRIFLALFLSFSLLGLTQTKTTTKKKATSTTKTTTTTKPKTTATATKTTEVAKTNSETNSKKSSSKTNSNSNYPLGIGKVQINAGTGFSTWGIPFYAGIDVGLTKDVSLGFETSYRIHNYNAYYLTDHKYNTAVLGFMVNGNYHFNKLLKLEKKFDLYAGVSAGYLMRMDEDNNAINYVYDSGVNANLQAGARYFLSKNFALNSQVEAGNLNHAIKAGITYKF